MPRIIPSVDSETFALPQQIIDRLEEDLDIPGGGDDGREVELRAAAGYIQWRHVGDTVWINLVALSSLAGASGESPELRNQGTFVQWKFPSASTWNNLVAIAELVGPQGAPGAQGAQGTAGEKGDKGDPGNQGPTGQAGSPGASGESPTLRISGGYVQWKFPSASTWTNLVPLTDITGPQGAQGAQGPQGPAGTPADTSTLAPKASPSLTGNPTAPTPSTDDNDTSIATTAFVRSAISTYAGGGQIAFHANQAAYEADTDRATDGLLHVYPDPAGA